MNRFYILLLAAVLFAGYSPTDACTNFLVTKGASKDGSTFISYSADAGGFMEPLYFNKGGKHAPNEMVPIYEWDSGKFLGSVKQAPVTYNVVGYINEHQVSLGETTFGGRDELRDTTAIIDYGSLMRLALQRSRTAREAIKIMGELVAEYGYYSSGESMSVADPNEVWIFEIISKGPSEKGAVWVAMRIPDGCVAAHANQARIRKFPLNDPENCMYAPDVISFAEKKGYYDPKKGDFSFVDAYCPLEPGGLLFCEGRVWSLFRRCAPSLNLSANYWRAVKGAEPYPLYIKPDRKIGVDDVMALMRDHFEGTDYDMTKGAAAGPYGSPYRWKSMTWKLEGDTATQYAWERPISSQQSAFSFVSQMRSWLPAQLGGIFWYGVDDAFCSVYTPLYSCLKEVPRHFARASVSDIDLESAAWVFNLVANLTYNKYSFAIKDVQQAQKELEGKYTALQPAVEKTAAELYKQDPKMMEDYLSDYSTSQSTQTYEKWLGLWKHMAMKYNDGYINDYTKDGGRHPKPSNYNDDFFRRAVEERPDYYEVKWRDKSEVTKSSRDLKRKK